MRTFGVSLCSLILIGSVCFGSGALAQDQLTAAEVKQLSSVPEIVDWLNKNSFPNARISLIYEGGEAYRDSRDAMESMSLSLSRLSEVAHFSPGFTLASLNGCDLKLKNEQVIIANWSSDSYDQHYMSLSRFLLAGRKGEKKLTPIRGVLFIPLDELSYKKGKGPYRYTNKEAIQRLLGTWRTVYQKKGLFRRTIFEMEVTAAEDPDLKGKMTAQYLAVTFDDKKQSEDFNVVFRRAIQLCTTK